MRGLKICLALVLVAAMALAHSQKDLYEVLGLKRDADEKEIKKSGRKLSAMYHPDRASDEGSKLKY